jgi:hypothetical protein
MTRLEEAQQLVAEQAKDEGLWFKAQTAPEAYLQQALRKLHEVIEGKSQTECAEDAILKIMEGS